MTGKKLSLLLLALVILQGTTPFINQSMPTTHLSTQKVVHQPLAKTGSVQSTLYVYPSKSEFTLTENVIIVVLLLNTATGQSIMDAVTVTTPLNTQIIQLSDSINQLSLNKEDFLSGLNTITVTYGSQVKSITILRRDPVTTGTIQSALTIHDILNQRPAPGVPDYINYSLSNSAYMNFPTEQYDYVQLSMDYQGVSLVLATRFYSLNDFIQFDQLAFSLPDFLSFTNYSFALRYSGDTFLTPTRVALIFPIHNFTPLVSASLTSTIIDKTDVLNESTSILKVSLEGYLPPTLTVTLSLGNVTLAQTPITGYRQNIPIAVASSIPTGSYILQALFNYSQTVTPVKFSFTVSVVQQIGLIVRTDTQFVIMGQPVLYDYFCYNPVTFEGVACSITMQNGSTVLVTTQTLTGHADMTMVYTGLGSLVECTYTLVVTPLTTTSLTATTLPYTVKFYQNTNISATIQKNIVDKKQLLSLEANVEGQFVVKDVNGLIIATYDYTQAESVANYFITFNDTHRGLNVFTLWFYPQNQVYENVSQELQVFVYDTITIQSVQTNASFYQLGSSILFQGVATLGNTLDSLNNVTVSVVLNGVVLQNTTIESNAFTFILKAPTSTGLKDYSFIIYADNSQFILTSQAYTVTVSVINNFGLYYTNSTYQVGDTIKLQVEGLQDRLYSVYYTVNGQTTILANFTYTGQRTVALLTKTYGHYMVYLEEVSTGEQTYYGINVLQNPLVAVEHGLLKTYTNTSLQLVMSRYTGTYKIKIDNLYPSYTTYTAQDKVNLTIPIYNVNAGNHSLTVLFDNQYTLQKVRTYYFIIYQQMEVASLTYSNNGKPIQEEDTIGMHLTFKDFTNESLNDIAIQIVTNDNTILAQANIFNSASDFQMTVIGTDLSLVIIQNDQQYIHQQVIPLNLTVYHLLTSTIKDSYSFSSSAKVNISFGYKYFPEPTTFNISYVVSDGKGGVSASVLGQSVLVPFNDNGHYNVRIMVTGYHCVNRTFVTTITVNKLFDLSNTVFVAVVVSILVVPSLVMGIILFKKHRSLFH